MPETLGARRCVVHFKGIYHPTASCDLFNLNTSDSEIIISEQSDWSVVKFTDI